MRYRLEDVEARYDEITRELSLPEVSSDPVRLRELGKQHAELHEIVTAHRAYRAALRQVEEWHALTAQEKDPDGSAEFRAEERRAEAEAEALRRRLESILAPKDPSDDKNVLLEIRAGPGGQEAALFAGDLYEMYRRYAERRRWKFEVLSSSPSELGGFKEVVLEIKGKGAFSRLRHESGVHRVQRIPVTESGGRIHTSTATVAVLPEAEDVDVQINPEDLKIDVYRSSGPGGQSVNTTDSAVRITHKPTGIKVEMQEERSQLQNREKAMRYLRAKLLQMAQDEQQREEAAARKAQVGTGDRSEKIRTYNFPQNRVTDHRVDVSVHNLPAVMAGDLDRFIDALVAEERRLRLGSAGDPADGPAG
ncbi:MAG TPA: peptide chain release factor 1 [Actinomycetota bacterium]|nr:peptide chain release factor 1 [Actinomycetota bacterium]